MQINTQLSAKVYKLDFRLSVLLDPNKERVNPQIKSTLPHAEGTPGEAEKIFLELHSKKCFAAFSKLKTEGTHVIYVVTVPTII